MLTHQTRILQVNECGFLACNASSSFTNMDSQPAYPHKTALASIQGTNVMAKNKQNLETNCLMLNTVSKATLLWIN